MTPHTSPGKLVLVANGSPQKMVQVWDAKANIRTWGMGIPAIKGSGMILRSKYFNISEVFF